MISLIERMKQEEASGVRNAAELVLIGSSGSGETVYRLFGGAGVLPAGEALCLQLHADEEGAWPCITFAAPEHVVEESDIAWIYERVSDLRSAFSDRGEDFFAPERAVFALQRIPEKDCNVKDESFLCSVYRDHSDLIDSMLNMLSKTNTKLRLILCGDPETGSVSGTILFSFCGAPSFRLRAAVSLAFPNARLISIADERLPTVSLQLQQKQLQHFACDAMNYLKRRHTEYQEARNPHVLDEVEIDELDLSVRTFNCLRRLNIYTIGELCEMTEEQLIRSRYFGRKCLEEVIRVLAEHGLKLAESTAEDEMLEAPELPEMLDPPEKEEALKEPAEEKETPAPAEDSRAALERLIGLTAVKTQIRRIEAYARLKQAVKDSGAGTNAALVLNMAFIGNPGTAKTTVARILAARFCEMGLLASGEILEVGRTDLVGLYVGHTADKVRSVFEKAKGKLLFIDEAYSLVEGWKGSYGDEAINTIVQEMENRREQTIVIFAGYPAEMESFFSRNPGLSSRVPFQLRFEDYSASELAQITRLEAEKRGFAVDPAAEEALLAACESAAGRPEQGNGRFCRNLVDQAILGYAERVYGDEAAPEQGGEPAPLVLSAADFSPLQMANEKPKPRVPIGFRAD